MTTPLMPVDPAPIVTPTTVICAAAIGVCDAASMIMPVFDIRWTPGWEVDVAEGAFVR